MVRIRRVRGIRGVLLIGAVIACMLSFAASASAVGPSVTIPALSTLTVSPPTLNAAGRKVHGKCLKATSKNERDKSCQLPASLTATYTLSASASVTFKLAMVSTGRQIEGTCLKATRLNKAYAKCTLSVSVRAPGRVSGRTGSNTLRFTDRLAAGTYQLTATPAAGASRTAGFRVSG
jgi:hypothetical protein